MTAIDTNRRSEARALWRLVEPYHQLAYRSPEAQARLSALGLDQPPWQYFASRLAAMGPISTEVAVAVLYGFAPTYVATAVPKVWSIAAPTTVSGARLEAADASLQRALGEAIAGDGVETAARLARRAAEAADLPGRPLAAAHLALGWPDAPHLVLWHACTVLREHRGDAHWAATAAAELDAVECHVLHGADGYMPMDVLQRVTGWSDEAWAAATDRLRRRGLLNAEGEITDEGRRVKTRLEHLTDRLAARPLAVLDDRELDQLLAAMRPLVSAIIAAGMVPTWEIRERLWRDLPPEA